MIVYCTVVTVALCMCADVGALFCHLSSHPTLQYKVALTPSPNEPFGLPLPFPLLIYKMLLSGTC